MKKDTKVTKVKFLYHVANDDLFAYFPRRKHTQGNNHKIAYSHVGQHSSCAPEYAKECREATEAEYKDLKAELEGIGYNLEISENTFAKVIDKVNTKFGAPMGRASNTEADKPTDKKICDRMVRLDSGGYDKGGAYWGAPDNLRVEYTKDLSYIRFYRTEQTY